MSLVPVRLREHLVPFFFNESEGGEALYLNKRYKSVLFPPSVSSVGRIMRLLMEKSGVPLEVQDFNLFYQYLIHHPKPIQANFTARLMEGILS